MKVGDRVRCTDGTPISELDENNEGVITLMDGSYVYFANSTGGWKASRFALVEEKKTVLSITDIKVGDRLRCIDSTHIPCLDAKGEGVVTMVSGNFVRFGHSSGGWLIHHFERVEEKKQEPYPYRRPPCSGMYMVKSSGFEGCPHYAWYFYDEHKWSYIYSSQQMVRESMRRDFERHPFESVTDWQSAGEQVETNKAAAPVSAAPSGVAPAKRSILLLINNPERRSA